MDWIRQRFAEKSTGTATGILGALLAAWVGPDSLEAALEIVAALLAVLQATLPERDTK